MKIHLPTAAHPLVARGRRGAGGAGWTRSALLERLGSAGRGTELFLQQVYDAFDTSQNGQMTELDLLAAALFLGVQVAFGS